MQEKLQLIASLFADPVTENPEESSPQLPLPEQHGKYYGGVYNGKKFMYSEKLIDALSIDKLEAFIKRQIGMV